MLILEEIAPTVIEVTLVVLSFAIPFAFFIGRWSMEKKVVKYVKFEKKQRRGHKKVFITMEIAYNGRKRGHMHPLEDSIKIKML